MVGEAGERIGGRLGLLALEGAQALERDGGVRDEQRRVVDDIGRQRRAASIGRQVAVRAGRGAQRQAEPAAVEIDAALELAGRRQRGQPRAVEGELARALVAQPGLRERELALHDLAHLHAGQPEGVAERARDDAQHRTVLACLGQSREGLPQPAPARRLPGLGRNAAERIAEHRRRPLQRGRVLLGARAGHEQRGGARRSDRLDEGRGIEARAPLDDQLMAALRAQGEAALSLHPDSDGHRQPAVQERARDVAQLRRGQVTRERGSERIIKALGRRAGRLHGPSLVIRPRILLRSCE